MGSWLIVSIWGDPGGWSKACYRVPEIHRVEKCKLSDIVMSENTYSYKCTLGALLEAYRNYISESIVYVADTLAFSRYLSKYVNSSSIPEHFESYNDIVNCVKLYINSILDNRDYIDPNDRDRVEYAILPSVGVYRRDRSGIIAEFTGSPLNYYYGLLFDLYSRLSRRRLSGKCVDTIVLDVSHGVNFMPILGFNAVIEAVKLYSLETQSSVRLVVLNSDPVTPGVQAGPPRNMNIVYCKVYDKEESLRELIECLRRPIDEKPFRVLERVKPPKEALDLECTHKSILKDIVGSVKVLLESLDKGLLLPLVYTLEKLEARTKIDDYFNKLVSLVSRVVKTRRLELDSSGVLKVKHDIVLNIPVELDLKALVILRVLTRTYGEYDFKEFKYNGKLAKMYSLNCLKSLVERYVTGVGRIIALHEISDIEERIGAYETLCGRVAYPILYKYIYDFTEQQVNGKRIIDYYRDDRDLIEKVKGKTQCPKQQPLTVGKVCERVFYAHAGFDKNITLVVRVNNGVYTGYIPDVNYEDIILKLR